MSQTYTEGFVFETKKEITKKDYINLCKLISAKLNKHYDCDEDEKIYIVPEATTEGGMKFMWKKMGKKYKTIRHHCHQKPEKGAIGGSWEVGWPRIKENTYAEWSVSDEVLFPEKTIGETFLKAFDGAPVWTMEELMILKVCYEHCGIMCKKMPKAKTLVDKV